MEEELAKRINEKNSLRWMAVILRGQPYDIKNLLGALIHLELPENAQGLSRGERVRLAIAESSPGYDPDMKDYCYTTHQRLEADTRLLEGSLPLELKRAVDNAIKRVHNFGVSYDGDRRELTQRLTESSRQIGEEKETALKQKVLETMKHENWKNQYDGWRANYFATIRELKNDEDFTDSILLGHYTTKSGFYLDSLLGGGLFKEK